jgi:hypothetical protein
MALKKRAGYLHHRRMVVEQVHNHESNEQEDRHGPRLMRKKEKEDESDLLCAAGTHARQLPGNHGRRLSLAHLGIAELCGSNFQQMLG